MNDKTEKPNSRGSRTARPRKTKPANSMSPCPLEQQLSQLLPLRPPAERFDLTRGYIPVLIAAGMMLALFGLAFTAGGELQKYKQEQSAVAARIGNVEHRMGTVDTRIGTMERKLDKLINTILSRIRRR